MSAIAAYARALAVEAGAAQPIASVAHLHVSARPLVFVPLTLAGEANAPLAALLGTSSSEPRLLVVPQPRDRTLRFSWAASLASVVLSYLESFAWTPAPDGGSAGAEDGPQLLVPNPGGVAFTRLLGRSTRFRRTDGDYPVDASVPSLGRWLTWFAERAEQPGSASLVALTDALGLHWATGQSAFEDLNLAAQLAWISPPPGRGGAEAARAAEDPARWPPAGPATDPGFDNAVLAPLIESYDGDAAALEKALLSQLEPVWELMWQAISLLRGLPPGASVAGRWARDCQAFAGYAQYLADGGLPQARRDGAVAAARRLAQLERVQLAYDVARSFDDPLVMADHRVSGEAFRGTVTSVQPDRRVPNDRGNLVTRPLVGLRPDDVVRLAPGTPVGTPQKPGQGGSVHRVEPDLVVVELDRGFGRTRIPPPGVLPAVGDVLTYSSVLASGVRGPALPGPDETPWTHGGPPQPYLPTDQDAGEEWE